MSVNLTWRVRLGWLGCKDQIYLVHVPHLQHAITIQILGAFLCVGTSKITLFWGWERIKLCDGYDLKRLGPTRDMEERKQASRSLKAGSSALTGDDSGQNTPDPLSGSEATIFISI